MVWKKGQSGNPNGRPKGAQNKSTELTREAVGKFVGNNVGKFSKWLDEIYEEQGAKEAMRVVTELLEYHIPKISRVEQQMLDKDGEGTDPADQLLTWLAARDTTELPSGKIIPQRETVEIKGEIIDG